MKKITALLLVLLISIGLVGCGGEEKPTVANCSFNVDELTTYNVEFNYDKDGNVTGIILKFRRDYQGFGTEEEITNAAHTLSEAFEPMAGMMYTFEVIDGIVLEDKLVIDLLVADLEFLAEPSLFGLKTTLTPEELSSKDLLLGKLTEDNSYVCE